MDKSRLKLSTIADMSGVVYEWIAVVPLCIHWTFIPTLKIGWSKGVLHIGQVRLVLFHLSRHRIWKVWLQSKVREVLVSMFSIQIEHWLSTCWKHLGAPCLLHCVPFLQIPVQRSILYFVVFFLSSSGESCFKWLNSSLIYKTHTFFGSNFQMYNWIVILGLSTHWTLARCFIPLDDTIWMERMITSQSLAFG